MSSRSDERGKLSKRQLTGLPPPHVSLMPLGGTVRPATNKTSVGFNEPEAATSLPASQDKDSYVESDTTSSEYTSGPNKGYYDPRAAATQDYPSPKDPRRRSSTGAKPVAFNRSNASTSLPVSQEQDNYGSNTKSSKTSKYTPRPDQGYPDPLAAANPEHQKAYRDSRRHSSSSSSTELGIKPDTRSSKGRAPQSERPSQYRYPERSDPRTGTASQPSTRRDGPSGYQGRRLHHSDREGRGRSPKRPRSQERQDSSTFFGKLTDHRTIFAAVGVMAGASLYNARNDEGTLGTVARAVKGGMTSIADTFLGNDRPRPTSRPSSRQRSRSRSRGRGHHEETPRRPYSRSRSRSRRYDEEESTPLVRVTSKDVKYLTDAEIMEVEHPSSRVPRQERQRASTPGPSRHRH